MFANPRFDAELLRRYDRPGPRYTSYPTAPQFKADFGEEALRAAAAPRVLRSAVAPHSSTKPM